MAHQETKNNVDHAFRPHIEQQSERIESCMNKLPKVDPLRWKLKIYISDLRSTNTFEQSEKVTRDFLDKTKILEFVHI